MRKTIRSERCVCVRWHFFIIFFSPKKNLLSCSLDDVRERKRRRRILIKVKVQKVSERVRKQVCVCVCLRVCESVCVQVCMCVFVSVWACVCECMSVCVYWCVFQRSHDGKREWETWFPFQDQRFKEKRRRGRGSESLWKHFLLKIFSKKSFARKTDFCIKLSLLVLASNWGGRVKKMQKHWPRVIT